MTDLIQSRGHMKRSITRALSYADNPPANATVFEIKARAERLDKLWADFVAATIQMHAFSNSPDYVSPDEDYNDYEDKYYTACGRYTELTVRLGHNTSPQPDGESHNLNDSISRLVDQQAELLSNMNGNSQPRDSELPKIQIPPFRGAYEDWPSFRDLFISTIDLRKSLTNTQRFHYLKSLLVDDAAKLVQHIPITNSAYSTAWARLVERFDRPRHLINSFLDSFMKLQPVQNENTQQLRKIADGANEIIRGLDAAGHVDRDIWIIYLIQEKIDPISRRKWIHYSRDQTSPTLAEFFEFLDNRCEELELSGTPSMSAFKQNLNGKPFKTSSRSRTFLTQNNVNQNKNCIKCNSIDHNINKCSDFISMSVNDRRLFVKSKSLCFNCLKLGHNSNSCKSHFKCRECNQHHHTLVHIPHPNASQTRNSMNANNTSGLINTPIAQSSHTTPNQPRSGAPWSTVSNISRNPDTLAVLDSPTTRTVLTSSLLTAHNASPLLPTALVDIRTSHGHYITCRVLLDCASELSYITERCSQSLGLSRSPSRIIVSGITGLEGETTRGSCVAHIKSKTTDHTFNACLHILSKITTALPTKTTNVTNLQLQGLSLADPFYNISAPIDVLLGADHVWNIFTFNKIHDSCGNPTAISTTLGWVITSIETQQQDATHSFLALADLDRTIRSFWEIEEIQNNKHVDPQNDAVEDHFLKTHSRTETGKYIVRLPFKNSVVQFGNTLQGTISRFNSVERRLMKNPNLREQYISFMREYEHLNHMRELSPTEIPINDGRVFYLPHHPVLGKKLRVVFDGSYKDTNGLSLNDSLHIGPSLQKNLFNVCLRFRMHKYVFSADIVKMFRQILISSDDCNYQRIIWREDPSLPIKHYQLCTVTYGTACAPFLSNRVLEQLALDYKDEYPVASKIVLNDFYVDDVLTGNDTESELLQTRDQLIELLSKAGLQLDKWVSNSSLIANSNPDVSQQEFLKAEDMGTKKVLGIFWNPKSDTLGYKVEIELHPAPTKRQVLSDVARIFDPLGLLAPIVIQFKILFQELWLLNLEWDDALPPNLMKWWINARNDLEMLSKISLPRYIPNHKTHIELHGFSDASIKAYSAAVYCRTISENGEIQVSLIASKTRVSPLKQHSIPRLELCGARELARLMSIITATLSHKNISTFAWCDSSVVLYWLSHPPSKLKPFVANRTSEILETLNRSCWHHVSSKDNPADCASRGMMTSNLINFDLWWNGPEWMRNELMYQKILDHSNRFDKIADPEAQSEVKTNAINLLTIEDEQDNNVIRLLSERVSTFWKLVRAVGYLKRYIKYLQAENKNDIVGSLNFDELMEARSICIKYAQNDFETERQDLLNNKEISIKSNIQKLNPFMDKKGIIRVGGRITYSNLAFDSKHPIIMPKKHRITHLIIQCEHEKHLHPGVNALFFILRQKYWIVSARNMIRNITFQCLKCFRYRQTSTQQKMSDLPAVRVREAFPFENTGCDYAGPLILKLYNGRKAKTSKGYICLFVCMTTSAIHLELATDLSTECFLAALKRFMARRGKCVHIFSDNGRNFLGASRVLNEMHQVLMSQQHNDIVSASLSEDGIRWTYIPPYSPHWGGIWESAVRSVKLHLRRVIGDTTLTFEQMNTLLVQIEAVVNSRPLGATPDTENNYLSPSHFLLGRPTTMVPEGNTLGINPNKLGYWQHVQNMMQGFWRRWRSEYITSLQNRHKWSKSQTNVKVDDLVLLKEQNVPPAKWPMGKIIEVFNGKDGLTRVVKLRTANGETIRPITKIVVLPIFRN